MLAITRTITLHKGAPADVAPDVEPVTLTTAAPGVVFVGLCREACALALKAGMPMWTDTGFYPDPDGVPWSERGIEPTSKSLLSEQVRGIPGVYRHACNEHAWLQQLPDARFAITAETFDAGYSITFTVEVFS